MIPACHPNTTRRLGAPSNWPADEAGPCGTLPICDIVGPAGPVMESIWELTPAELDALANGGMVVLGISGTAHPVVYLSVYHPASEGAG
jgi:hypothetical protein